MPWVPGIPEKDSKKLIQVNLDIDKDLQEWYQQEANRRGLYVSNLMSHALYEFYKHEMILNKIKELEEMLELEEMKEFFEEIKDLKEQIVSKKKDY